MEEEQQLEIHISVADGERVLSAYSAAYGWPEDASDKQERIKALMIEQIRQTVDNAEYSAFLEQVRAERPVEPLEII